MGHAVVVVGDDTFDQEALQTSELVLAYFWAAWCGPCRLMSPSIDWVAQTYGDRLKVVKLEVDPNPRTVAQYKIQGVPALVLLQQGKVMAVQEGAIAKPKLAAFLEEHLSMAP